MENEETEDFVVKNDSVHDNSSAVNKLILDYYKKFGRKRNIEQFFSLSTVENSLGDTSSSFWKTMKEQNDSSDSTELCRISIKCSMQDPNNSMENKLPKSDVESPPIISEEVFVGCVISDDDCNKSDGDHSQKSNEMTLDTSMNRPHSPTSSVTSQRKLEWDPLADVGYPTESNRKNSASSLSTLERLALHQQYSNNDSIQNSNLGAPTAHSTPLEQTDNLPKVKRNDNKKITTFCKKDIDIMELNVPSTSDVRPQPINVNLTKNISFNVERDGNIRMDNITKNVSLNQEKVSIGTEVTQPANIDKNIQTTLIKSYPKDIASSHKQVVPVLISLNTLRKRNKKKKCIRKLSRQRKKLADKENRPLEKNQVSEAESFEYMPGHIYNQNKVENKNSIHDNKSSLESSTTPTTETSKVEKCTFSIELEKSIDLLKLALKHSYEDTNLKKRLIKEVIQRLIKTKYKGDNSSTDYLSGVSHNNHTTSTSDSNNSGNKKPKKSILRSEKFNSNEISATSQSVPNLPMVSNIDNKLSTNPGNLTSTDSDLSYKNKNLSEAETANPTSEQIYRKYLMTLKKENEYKRQLTEKEEFLNDVLKNSNVFSNNDIQDELKTKNSLSHLIKDLARNNYDDGSGDASKLECASSSNVDLEINSLKKFRSHSVFTLSSGNSENQKRNKKLRSRLENEVNTSTERNSLTKKSCSCSTTKHNKVEVTDSCIQVNLNSINKHCPQDTFQDTKNKQSPCSSSNSKKEIEKVKVDSSKNIEYVCLCTEKPKDVPENFLIYRCSRLPNKCVMVGDGNMSENIQELEQLKNMKQILLHEMKFSNDNSDENKCVKSKDNLSTQASQTKFNLNKLLERNSCNCFTSVSTQQKCIPQNKTPTKISTVPIDKPINFICECTRWAQTEISIDPKISEPSMTDIRTIIEECCAGLVSERERPISEFSSECSNVNEPKPHLQYKTHECKLLNKKALLENSEVYTTTTNSNNKINKGIQSCANVDNNLTDPDAQNNFTIPIHGTNMTLNVSLGSGDKPPPRNVLRSPDTSARKISEQPKEMKIQKSGTSEQFTYMQPECSVGVQSENVNLLEDYDKRNKKNDVCGEIKANTSAIPSYNCLSNDRKFNTYPKESILKKPLLRSNTDIGKMEHFNPVTFKETKKKDANTQYDSNLRSPKRSNLKDMGSSSDGYSNTRNKKSCEKNNIFEKDISNPRPCSSNSNCSNESKPKDPLLDIIQDITRRYSKKEFEKGKRKKCFKEIITVLNYLLDTGESTDNDGNKNNIILANSSENEFTEPIMLQCTQNKSTKAFIDRGVQLPNKKTKTYKICTESSEFPFSTDVPSTSTESATCKVLHKIRQECEDYHKKRCKSHTIKHEVSSSTSINCDEFKHVRHCSCRNHKSHRSRGVERCGKKCVAYNLIVQTSDSIGCEDENNDKCERQLKNIIVKVPSKSKVKNMMFNEIAQKIERRLPCSQEKITLKKSNISNKDCKSKSFRREKETSCKENIIGKSAACTVREYLEKNRPDFIENCAQRQNCLKSISETRGTNCKTPQLNMIVVHTPKCMSNTYCGGIPMNMGTQCNDFFHNMCCFQNDVARVGIPMNMGTQCNEFGHNMCCFQNDVARVVAPKFISEKDMKKHSEKIYKSLPEVQRKQEEMKKDKIKKTNLLTAEIFKKNLQKKTLRGAVNLSNYSAVVKI